MVNEQERAIFADAYRLFQQFNGELDSDEKWDALCKKVGELTQKHDSKLCTNLLVAIYESLESGGDKYGKNAL